MCRHACLLLGGPTRMILDRHGKEWWFEEHPSMGPMPLTPKTHEPASKEPPQNSPFWEAVQNWYDQGKRISSDGRLLWHRKPEPILEHLGGKHYQWIGQTEFDDDGNEIPAAAIEGEVKP